MMKSAIKAGQVADTLHRIESKASALLVTIRGLDIPEGVKFNDPGKFEITAMQVVQLRLFAKELAEVLYDES